MKFYQVHGKTPKEKRIFKHEKPWIDVGGGLEMSWWIYMLVIGYDASSSNNSTEMLFIQGLVDFHGFMNLVWHISMRIKWNWALSDYSSSSFLFFILAELKSTKQVPKSMFECCCHQLPWWEGSLTSLHSLEWTD